MELFEMTWPAVAALERDMPVVIPIAALEQHGRHMPVFTDSLLLGEVIRRVKQTPIADRLLFTPLQWLGNSHHHLDLPGTVSAPPRLYLDLLQEIAENFLHHGFRRIVFVNGHGGNTIPSQHAMFELRQKYRQRADLLLATLTYWDSCQPAQLIPGLVQSRMGHACEWETSMMLALRPELVSSQYREVPDIAYSVGAEPGYRGWTMTDRSEPGHVGHPAASTAEKGVALFAAFANGVQQYLERVVHWSGRSWDV